MFPSSLVSARDSVTDGDDTVELNGIVGLIPPDECRILGLTYKNDGEKIHENTLIVYYYAFKVVRVLKLSFAIRKKSYQKGKLALIHNAG